MQIMKMGTWILRDMARMVLRRNTMRMVIYEETLGRKMDEMTSHWELNIKNKRLQ